MARYGTSLLSLPAILIGITACGTAYADRTAPGTAPRARAGAALASAPAASPYSIDIIDENGSSLTAYQHRGRVYVLGNAGQRYTVRLTNPTARRIEAVISVDGLDVIDGEAADLRKRGYVVPPYGEVRVDGFRVSTEQVAAFRFSSVQSSYAGRKGKARNVGVIGVAIFEEQEAPQMVFEPPPPPPRPYHRGRYGDAPASNERGPAPGAAKRSAPAADASAEASAPSAPARPAPRRSASRAPSSRGSRAPATGGAAMEDMPAEAEARECCGRPRSQHRPGLGTEFGERRHSAVSWTRFVRAHPHRPSTLLELRYNDLAGLQALGIRIVDTDEVLTRETANPFPGDQRFSRPPR